MDNSHNDNSYRNMRGKFALDDAHKGIAKEDESLVNLKISQLYSVDIDEAEEIHINYHIDRLISMLYVLSKNHGMTYDTFKEKLQQLNIEEIAIQISKGVIYERVGLDVLYRELAKIERVESKDRYINFYG